jgi:CRISPR-associated endonuclease Cas1 subtype II
VKVIFCDEKRQPSAELVPYYGCHDCSGKLRTQITWTDNIKTLVWTEIVREKITKQLEHLEMYQLPSVVLLEDYLRELSLGDETNREGHAARVYFSALFGEDFSRSQENSINAALNYGYSILLSMFNREIAVNGYSTMLGIFHDNADNPFNLGSDLMEPFRILVDRMVKQEMPDKFETEEKHWMLELVKCDVNISGKKEYLPNAIRIYVRSVFDAINDNDISEIKFYRL